MTSNSNTTVHIIYLDYTPSEFQSKLGANIMSLIENGTIPGAYDAAFEWPFLRAFYIAHWAITLILGTLFHLSLQKVPIDTYFSNLVQSRLTF